MIACTLQMHIYSDTPAEPRIWCQRITRSLAAVPRAGDLVELADGWASVQVKDAYFGADGSITIELRPIKTDNPEILREHWTLADEHGWEWIGGAPARTERTPS